MNFEHFLACCLAPKLLINARTIDVKILINVGTLAPKVANWASQMQWYPFFSALGRYKAIKFSNLGQIEKIFFFSFSLDS